MTKVPMFSEVCPVVRHAAASVQAIEPYQPGKPIEELQREYSLSRVSKLASNENPLGTSHKATQAIQNALMVLGRYPDGHGFYLKEALSEFLNRPVTTLAIGNGSNELLEFIARLFAGPGDEIIYSEHAFAVYALATQVVGATAVEVPSKHWGHDLSAMAKAITDKTRVIYLANPNNPTGTYFDKRQWTQFIQAVPDDVVVVLDEAYFEYVPQREAQFDGMDYLPHHPNLVVTRSFSKAYGLAALRVGYLSAHPEIVSLINQLRAPFNVNHLAQVAATAALKDPVFVRKTVELNHEGMQLIQGFLKENSLNFIPSSANFICVDLGDQAHAVNQALLKEGVIVRPLAPENSDNPLRHFLRVSIGTASENRHFMQAMTKLIRTFDL